MFRLDEGLKVYLHRAPEDFRLNINGLATLVQQALGLDPFAACVYAFSNPSGARSTHLLLAPICRTSVAPLRRSVTSGPPLTSSPQQ